MNFKFHHSLASRAAVSVVTTLWYHEDIDALKTPNGIVASDVTRREFPFNVLLYNVQSTKRIHRMALHVKVRDSVSKLFIPESLKRHLLKFVQIIGENLEDWIESHYMAPQTLTEVYGHECFAANFLDIATSMRIRNSSVYIESSVNGTIDVDLRQGLRWNPDGEIDLEQTGEAMVRNESDSIKRFRLACAYCREDEMLRLWPIVQAHFSSPEAWDSNDSQQICALFWWRYFLNFWPRPITTYLLDLISKETVSGVRLLMEELECSCSWAFSKHCSPLTLYLLNKLYTIDTLRNDHLKFLIRGGTSIADKHFSPIFIRMPKTSHDQVLRDSPESVFKQLLLWHHQSFFMDTVERSWDIFDNKLFVSILFHIARGVERYDSDAYKEIFLRFWTASPARLRNVERIFYDRRVGGPDTTLRHFALLLFGHSPAAEDRMKRVLIGGRHVLELATRVCELGVLSDLVRTCLPPEEQARKLELLSNFFAAHPQSHRHAAKCLCSFQRV